MESNDGAPEEDALDILASAMGTWMYPGEGVIYDSLLNIYDFTCRVTARDMIADCDMIALRELSCYLVHPPNLEELYAVLHPRTDEERRRYAIRLVTTIKECNLDIGYVQPESAIKVLEFWRSEEIEVAQRLFNILRSLPAMKDQLAEQFPELLVNETRVEFLMEGWAENTAPLLQSLYDEKVKSRRLQREQSETAHSPTDVSTDPGN